MRPPKCQLYFHTQDLTITLVIEAKTGWDLYAIEQQFYDYINKVGQPKNLELAFIGFVKKKIQICP